MSSAALDETISCSPNIFPVQIADKTISCSYCGEAASQVCSGCNDVPASNFCCNCKKNAIDIKETYYCSALCQRFDWPRHKLLCKLLRSRKTLFRAASTLQEIFYAHREKVFDTEVEKVEEKDGKLYVHEKTWKPINIKNPHHLIVPFPSSIFENPEDKMAVLANKACVDAVAWMHELVIYFLSDLACNFTELSLKPNGHKREVVQVIRGREDKKTYRHDIIKFESLYGGDEYVLDMTGAQFGHYKPLISWHEYASTRVEYIEEDSDNTYFGGRKGELEDLSRVRNAMGAIFAVNKGTSKEMGKAVRDWEKENNLTIQEFLKLPENDFKQKKRELVDRISLEIGLYLARARDYFVKSIKDRVKD